jgi:PAS domain S-box-containing protein
MERSGTAAVSRLQRKLLASMDSQGDFQELFNYVDSVFFFVKDLEGRILFANQQLLHHYGFKKPEEMIGKTDFEFLPRSLAQKYRWDDERVASSKEPLVRQVELFLDDKGVPDWYFTTKLPLLGRHGSAIGVMGVIQKFNRSHPRFFEDKKLSHLINYLNDHYLENIQPRQLSQESGMSPRNIQRLFKAKLNTTPRDMLVKARVLKACDDLRLTDLPLSTIAVDCGFYDQSSFTRHFKKHIGMTPRRYRAGY